MFQVLLFCVCLIKALTSPQPGFSTKNDNINNFSESENLYHLSLRGRSGVWEGEGLGAHTAPCRLMGHGAGHPDVLV